MPAWQAVSVALWRALRSLLSPAMLWLALWPLLLSLGLWMVIAALMWGQWLAGVGELIAGTALERWLAQGVLAFASHYLVSILLASLLLPVIYITALAITAVFGMPSMLRHASATAYPALQRKQGGSVLGGLLNGLFAVAMFVVGWAVSLPLMLFSPFALVLPVLLMAYLNQRLFAYDALAEHASREEMQVLLPRLRPALYLLGALVGLLQYVPGLNLFTPVLVGLAFVHLCLAGLERLRREAGNPPAPA